MVTNFLNQLRENNRLRWGLFAIVGIAWLYGVLVLRDGLQEQLQQQRTAAQATARLRTQLTQTEWVARLPSVKILAVQTEARLWQAATAGLAQAAFQDWINATAVKSGVVNPQVSVAVVDDALSNPASGANPDSSGSVAGGAIGTPPDLWKLKGKISFELGTTLPTDFLARVENNERQVVIASANLRKEPAPRAEYELFAFFQKPSSNLPAVPLTPVPSSAPARPPTPQPL